MCGIFAFFSHDQALIEKVAARSASIEATIIRRGPDGTRVRRGEDFYALHTLLSMTGYAEQPVQTSKWMFVFNGEIYNDYQNYRVNYSDTQYLSNVLLKSGKNALSQLDGEYAICARSFTDNEVYVVTDPFGTKPLYIQQGNGFLLVASYESTVKACGLAGRIEQVRANQLRTYDSHTLCEKSRSAVKTFDFGSATNTSMDRWNAAFSRAIAKRTANVKHGIWVGLSSGHDSGLIAAELVAQKRPFHVYTVPFKEDEIILDSRIQMLESQGITCQKVVPSASEFEGMREYLAHYCEDTDLVNTESDYQPFAGKKFREVAGYVVSAIINQDARRNGRLISLSGQGADEIIADYYCEFANPKMSCLKGNWNAATKPWPNFFEGWNRVFLGGSERIAGTFGVETRYPFLDAEVVQEYLYLSPELKASGYKAPISQRLKDLGFPFHLRKFGFAGFDDQKIEKTRELSRAAPAVAENVQ